MQLEIDLLLSYKRKGLIALTLNKLYCMDDDIFQLVSSLYRPSYNGPLSVVSDIEFRTLYYHVENIEIC